MKYIIVVEDDEILGQSIADVFGASGFEIDWVTDGAQMFEKLALKAADMIYLDIMLSDEMDGYHILSKLKEIGSPYHQIPVVMLTNLGQTSEMERASQLGATDYVIKANIDLLKLVDLTKKKLNLI